MWCKVWRRGSDLAIRSSSSVGLWPWALACRSFLISPSALTETARLEEAGVGLVCPSSRWDKVLASSFPLYSRPWLGRMHWAYFKYGSLLPLPETQGIFFEEGGGRVVVGSLS